LKIHHPNSLARAQHTRARRTTPTARPGATARRRRTSRFARLAGIACRGCVALLGLLGFIGLAACFTPAAQAHHGVASLGVAGLEGPGAPIETSSSATLPARSFLAYLKLDFAQFETYTDARDDEGDYNAFWMYGLGYGLTPSLSVYAFAPFYTKKPEDNSFTTSGFADLSLMGVFGFKLDRGLKLIPARESLDDLEDWHFTLYGGATLPTGNENLRNADGEIDPGMALGFGRPSFTAGVTATRPFFGRLTFVFDTSFITFQEHEYADGAEVRFGDEFRLNVALPVRALVAGDPGLRVDVGLEANYLSLGRDELGGIGEAATGGKMLYLVPGSRLYYGNSSLGLGIKVPVWTDLNEEEEQQGAEGKESYRAIVTFSTLL